MYQHLTECETHAESMPISFCFSKTCIRLRILENIQISVNMIDRLDITGEYSVKCDLILHTVIFIEAALNISLRKVWKCDVFLFYLFGQGVPNETKGMVNLNIVLMRDVITLSDATPYDKMSSLLQQQISVLDRTRWAIDPTEGDTRGSRSRSCSQQSL